MDGSTGSNGFNDDSRFELRSVLYCPMVGIDHSTSCLDI